jgi:hypothetical protein
VIDAIPLIIAVFSPFSFVPSITHPVDGFGNDGAAVVVIGIGAAVVVVVGGRGANTFQVLTFGVTEKLAGTIK